ncbi:MAG: glycogen debranching protein GlgX [Planctomycetia bacterium]|nr:glycogen debranching protein GlgX [Planctomycetia bacterium]
MLGKNLPLMDAPAHFPSVPTELLTSRSHPDFDFTHPLSYGALVWEKGVQFVVFSRSATAMRVLLYDKVADTEPVEVIAFHRDADRWGDVWSLFVPGIGKGQLYHFQADGPFDPSRGQRFDPRARLMDPYAKALAGDFQPGDDGIIRPPKCVVIDDHFDWQGDRHLRRRLSETVIYELHVRGFTRSPSSGAANPGTYLGLIEKIPYLKSLGVTAVELMPVHEFPILDWYGQPRQPVNYWGYDPLAFFSPHRGYACSQEPGAQVREFKQLVMALHQAGIEVILDVVFNHTCEGNEQGPTLSFKGLENRVYYMLDSQGGYRNYSGCGNTVNGNHPIVRELIFNCLRHWVLNYHVDGFRFDLASILSRNRRGELIPEPPLVELIAEDPLLADTKIIAEAWDAAGAYQVGSFANSRWSEWNGRFRDDVRRFWRGDEDTVGALATRLAGSSDLYEQSGRRPFHSINFVTSHDGFTLHDLVSYEQKHNEANGEEDNDGENHNFCCNYGVEGPTRRRAVVAVRRRQVRNFLATLMLSQGVPMLLAGDECLRSQHGNNNAYCQDNEMSWFHWRLVKRHADLVRFCQALIAFRKSEPTVRRIRFLRGQPEAPGALPDVAWFGPDGAAPDWHGSKNCLGYLLAATPPQDSQSAGRHVLVLTNATEEAVEFKLPDVAQELAWRLFVDTAAKPPLDIYPDVDGPPLAADAVTLEARSLRCWVAQP